MGEIIRHDAGSELVCWEETIQWLSRVADVQQAQNFRDRMEETAHLLRRRGYGLEAINKAAELKLRAERRLGELLREMPKHKGGRPSENRSHDARGLADIGINWTQSSRWQQVASVPEEIFEQHIAEVKTTDRELTTAGALRLAKSLRQPGKQEEPSPPDLCSVEDLSVLVERGLRFRTIYADPPWQYGNQGTRASTDNHYRTMPTEAIAALPVRELAAESAHLHLWTTNGFLPDAFSIIEAWGFTYKSCFVWCKPQIGLGNYWRVSHEFLLLGVKGSCAFRDNSLPSWAVEDRTAHSSKPEKFRRLIERASHAPRLELFGRHEADGWVVWGDQIARTMFDQATASAAIAESEEEPEALLPFARTTEAS